jgi:hypothetical protein
MPPAYNPREERNELVHLLHAQPPAIIAELYMNDPLINAALDYLDPEMSHFFIESQAVRTALLDGVKLHILAVTGYPLPAPSI